MCVGFRVQLQSLLWMQSLCLAGCLQGGRDIWGPGRSPSACLPDWRSSEPDESSSFCPTSSNDTQYPVRISTLVAQHCDRPTRTPLLLHSCFVVQFGDSYAYSRCASAGWVLTAIANLGIIFILGWRPRRVASNSGFGK
jgi:hypothetical protein